MSPPSPRRCLSPLALTCCLLVPLSVPAAPLPTREDAPRRLDPTTVGINDLLLKHWNDNNLQAALRTDDYQFLRRVTLDLVGRIATPDEVRAFTADRRADKRLRVIDRLLQSDECNAFWADLSTDTLLPTSTDAAARERFVLMMRDHFARNGSYKDLVKQLLTATGKANENPAVLFSLSLLGNELPKETWADEGRFDAIPLTEKVGRTFLAVDLHCIRCHDHPYKAELRQHQFAGMMGFFRQLDRVQEKSGEVSLIDNPDFNDRGLLFFERLNGRVNQTRVAFLDGTRTMPGEKKRRLVLAEHVTRHAHFSKLFVNRTWEHFFGRGLTEQPHVDDFHEGNPFVHPELIDRLARDFAASGYQPKQLMRWICASDAYQLHGAGLQPPAVSFHRAGWRPLSAKQRLNAMLTALSADTTLTAKERQTLRDGWLATLPVTPETCEAHLVPADQPTPTATNLERLRFMAASPELATSLTHPQGTVAKALEAKKPIAILDHLYLAVYNRYPTAEEVLKLLMHLTDPRRPQITEAAWQDLFWTMLNTSEFLGNR